MAIDIMYECIQMDELDATYKHIILVYTKYGLWINRYELLGMSTILKMKKKFKTFLSQQGNQIHTEERNES